MSAQVLENLISQLHDITEQILEEEIPVAWRRCSGGIEHLNNYLLSRHRDAVFHLYGDPVHRHALKSEFNLTEKKLSTPKAFSKLCQGIPSAGPVLKLSAGVNRAVSSHHALFNILFPQFMGTYDDKICKILRSYGYDPDHEESLTLRGVYRYSLSFPTLIHFLDHVAEDPAPTMPMDDILQGMNQRANICVFTATMYEGLKHLETFDPVLHEQADYLLALIHGYMEKHCAKESVPVVHYATESYIVVEEHHTEEIIFEPPVLHTVVITEVEPPTLQRATIVEEETVIPVDLPVFR